MDGALKSWPAKARWTRSDPQSVGVDPEALAGAIQFAQRHESPMDRDIAKALEEGHFGEPWPEREVIGPVQSREDPNGMILKGGSVIADWGDTSRVDMTFSASKSYLALSAGLAVDDGLIPDIDAPVCDLVSDGGFDSDQNRSVTWRHLLQLTSEWQGTLFGKPDSIDHNRDLTAKAGDLTAKAGTRQLRQPGSHWEYNDVRVNRLALSLLRVFKRPLPEILKERVMDPIGASDSWIWHGYRNSFVTIDGQSMQSVSGGAHWGGGLWISSEDHARIGWLVANRGTWNGRAILSAEWIDACLRPCSLNPSYGFMWWLNTDRILVPGAPATSVFARGVGSNIIWVDRELDLVAVIRWIDGDAFSEFAKRLTSAFVR